MRFEGRVWKDGKHWLVEVPAFDAMTQGRTKKEALAMIVDLIETMSRDAGLKAVVYKAVAGRFEIGGNKTASLTALLLRRQREASGLSLAQVVRRLGQTSRTAYARYERGDSAPTVEKLEQLLAVVTSHQHFVWRLAS